MKSKLTIKDIAKELGVSISTVSKALKDSHEISLETRERIKAFANYHNYKPNKLALKLRHQRTHAIGVIIPEISNYFFSTVLRGVEEKANDMGFNIMFCHSNESYEKELSSIETLMEGSVDGILLSTSIITHQKNQYDHINKLLNDKFPIVLFDRMIDGIDCDQVIIDDEGGAFKATQHLIETGCKRIALLTIPDFVRIGALRKKGYLKALNKYNIEIEKNLIVEINDDEDMWQQIIFLFKNEENYPDAILAAHGEICANTAMQIAKEKGLNIPDDVSVITFTDGLISRYSSPAITAVMQHGFEMGKQAVELLIGKIKNEKNDSNFEKKVISTTLKVRKSTKPFPA